MQAYLLPLLLLGASAIVVTIKQHQVRPPELIVHAPERNAPLTPSANELSILPDSPLKTSSPGGGGTPWEVLEKGDLGGFVRALREGGCPEETVRDFAVAALARKHQQRVEEPTRRRAQRSTWWKESPDGPIYQDLAHAMRRERAELDLALFELLGITGDEIRRDLGWDHRPLNWLPAELRHRLTSLEQRHAAEVAEIEARALPGAMGPILSDELRAQLRELRTRHREELGAILGPEYFQQHLVRESAEAKYVLHNLPQARNEEDFALLVRAAVDVGVEQADILADQNAAHVPPQVLGIERPRLKNRILERFRERSDPDRMAELEEELAAEAARQEEERARQREQSQIEDFQEIATSAGVEVSLDEIRQFTEALERHGTELERQWGTPPGNPSDAERALWEERLKSEFEKIATSVFGERGRAITEEMVRQQKKSR